MQTPYVGENIYLLPIIYFDDPYHRLCSQTSQLLNFLLCTKIRPSIYGCDIYGLIMPHQRGCNIIGTAFGLHIGYHPVTYSGFRYRKVDIYQLF